MSTHALVTNSTDHRSVHVRGGARSSQYWCGGDEAGASAVFRDRHRRDVAHVLGLTECREGDGQAWLWPYATFG
eukprot:2425861-Heterocapsa_arctica.AAC.1